MVIDALPPGCAPSAMYALASYTLPLTRIHVSSAVSCASISFRVKSFAPGGGGTYPETLTAVGGSAAATARGGGAAPATKGWTCAASCVEITGAVSPARSAYRVSTPRSHPPATDPIQPPVLAAGSVGCSNQTFFSASFSKFTLTLKCGLFPMPMRFQVGSRGWQLLDSSHARHAISDEARSSLTSTLYVHRAQHHCLPYSVAGHGSL
mmetsp:Transcript_43993/g.70694  ORF Transcript_43993/g.70694 Transcript_43993/m.70694 type:complete len:208 (+) Transcript_43993:762-1385(+)